VTRDEDLEATIVAKFVVMSPVLNERARRLWAAAESIAIGYGGDALVSSATGLARETIRNGRRELAAGALATGRIRRPGAGRPSLEQDQPGLTAALERLVDPLTRGDPTSPLRWTCKSRAQLTAALMADGWRVSSRPSGACCMRSATVSKPCGRPAKGSSIPIETRSSSTSMARRRRSSARASP
jgi:hypothetical protein